MGHCQVLTRNSSGDEIAKRDLMIHAGYGGLATFEESHSHTTLGRFARRGDPLGRSSRFLVGELPDGKLQSGQATKCCKNIPEKLNPLRRVHTRHRRHTDNTQTDLSCH